MPSTTPKYINKKTIPMNTTIVAKKSKIEVTIHIMKPL